MRRSPLQRFLAIGWAIFHMALPALSAIADGRLVAETASGPATHVEATTSASCPQGHSPDCAICRYLSGSSSPQQPAAFALGVAKDAHRPDAEPWLHHVAAIGLPHGRAPPASNV